MNWQDKNILVTGGAGFIGSHLCSRLLELGATVIAIDNLSPYYDPQLKRYNLKKLQEFSCFHFHQGCALDLDFVEDIFFRYNFDSVFHLAARAGVRASLKQPVKYMQANVAGTMRILQQVYKNKIPHLVLASSSSVYGNSPTPFVETASNLKQISPYAVSKRSAELLCQMQTQIYETKIHVLRLFTVYGPHGRPDMAPLIFLKKIMAGEKITRFGDGATSRDYTYVNDVVKAFLATLKCDRKFEIFNIGSSQPVSLNQFIATIEAVVGKKAKIKQKPIPTGDVQSTYADIKKANQILGWQPKTTLKTGLQLTYNWLLEQ